MLSCPKNVIFLRLVWAQLGNFLRGRGKEDIGPSKLAWRSASKKISLTGYLEFSYFTIRILSQLPPNLSYLLQLNSERQEKRNYLKMLSSLVERKNLQAKIGEETILLLLVKFKKINCYFRNFWRRLSVFWGRHCRPPQITLVTLMLVRVVNY